MRLDKSVYAVGALTLGLAATAFSTSAPATAPGTAGVSGPAAPGAAAITAPAGGGAAGGVPAAGAESAAGGNRAAAPVRDAKAARVDAAVDALAPHVARMSSDDALSAAARAYYSYRDANPNRVKKPYLYFVDYGLDGRTARGYVFNMDDLTVVEGPFMVSHGRGSSQSKYAVPSKFSNVSGSAATSLGLYVGAELYGFTGKAGGRVYRSTGMRMDGVSGKFNSAARTRRVVAHGAPYVSAGGAGRSEGCPAMEPARAKRLLPLIADGGMIFLYSPNHEEWVDSDPWAAE